ncbi:hypothetical protein CDV36_015395 [Fusarium kuroshium]|uniref:Uncharacterized protein n=1 Tax=Fusarium kuroshium TaxID=2010991 RepID=A0A3M2RAP1_9HYPO|nr:hypothetical protein CDV36_015395 [Fusarium kuroshium]
MTLEDTSCALVPLTSQVAFSYVLRILLRLIQNEIIISVNILPFFLLFWGIEYGMITQAPFPSTAWIWYLSSNISPRAQVVDQNRPAESSEIEGPSNSASAVSKSESETLSDNLSGNC